MEQEKLLQSASEPLQLYNYCPCARPAHVGAGAPRLSLANIHRNIANIHRNLANIHRNIPKVSRIIDKPGDYSLLALDLELDSK